MLSVRSLPLRAVRICTDVHSLHTRDGAMVASPAAVQEDKVLSVYYSVLHTTPNAAVRLLPPPLLTQVMMTHSVHALFCLFMEWPLLLLLTHTNWCPVSAHAHTQMARLALLGAALLCALVVSTQGEEGRRAVWQSGATKGIGGRRCPAWASLMGQPPEGASPGPWLA